DVDLPSVDMSLPSVDVDLPSLPDVDLPSVDMSLPSVDVDLPSLPDVDLPKLDADIELPKLDVDLPSVDMSLPSVDVDLPSLPDVDVDLPKLDVDLPSLDADIELPKLDVDLPALDVDAPTFDLDAELPTTDLSILEGDFIVEEIMVDAPLDTAVVDVLVVDIDGDLTDAEIEAVLDDFAVADNAPRYVEITDISPDTPITVIQYEDIIAEPEATIQERSEVISSATDEPSTEMAGWDDLTAVVGIGPKIAKLLNQYGINNFVQLGNTEVYQLREMLEQAGPRYKLADPATWPAQGRLLAAFSGGTVALSDSERIAEDFDLSLSTPETTAAPDALIVDYVTAEELAANENAVEQALEEADIVIVEIEADEAAPAIPVDDGFVVVEEEMPVTEKLDETSAFVDDAGSDDDLTLIAGIGPRVAAILESNGISSYARLARSNADHLRAILSEAGPRYAQVDPSTWPQQAMFAAADQWDGLHALQAEMGVNWL
ncbi:MAG: helix-hairpin-helix domain-containing protein, partial [Anaerolineae bacterium]